MTNGVIALVSVTLPVLLKAYVPERYAYVSQLIEPPPKAIVTSVGNVIYTELPLGIGF